MTETEMIELAALNVALLLILCGLPRRPGENRRAARRTAKDLLRMTHRARVTRGAPLAVGVRHLARIVWPVPEPRLLVGLPHGAARAAVAVPALMVVALTLGGAVGANDVPVAGHDVGACVDVRDQGRMTGPERERTAAPAPTGYLTET
jgi:hypothetical protein